MSKTKHLLSHYSFSGIFCYVFCSRRYLKGGLAIRRSEAKLKLGNFMETLLNRPGVVHTPFFYLPRIGEDSPATAARDATPTQNAPDAPAPSGRGRVEHY